MLEIFRQFAALFHFPVLFGSHGMLFERFVELKDEEFELCMGVGFGLWHA